MTKVGKLVVVLLLLGAVGVEAYFYTNVGVAEPRGVWKDVDSEYYITFRGDGEYTDSEFGMPCSVERTDSGLVFTDLVGRKSLTTLTRNLGKHTIVSVNGKTHNMVPFDGAPKNANWDIVESMNCVGAYKLKSDIGASVSIRLYDNSVCVITANGVVERCKYVKDDSEHLYIFRRDTDYVECLVPWTKGYVFGEVSNSVSYNLVSGGPVRNRGYELNGRVLNDAAGVHYNFIDGISVEREAGDGDVSDFLYYADANGLITMTDMAGIGVRDYLYLDAATGSVYRYVLESDDWFEYLTKGVE